MLYSVYSWQQKHKLVPKTSALEKH